LAIFHVAIFPMAILAALATIPGLMATRAAASPAEPDPRTLPWETLRRLALENGQFLPPYRPVSEDEIAEALAPGDPRRSGRPADSASAALTTAWRARFTVGDRALGRRQNAAGQPRHGWLVGGGLRTTFDPRGDAVVRDAGLHRARGTTAVAELQLDAWRGRWWCGVSTRLAGRVAPGGQAADPALLYADWPLATGRPPQGTARESRGAWRVDWPRLVGGLRLGNWALSLGWTPRAVGASPDGGLTLSEQPPSFPALTVRRTAPFRWRGFISWLGPDHLLLTAGRLDGQNVVYETERGRETRWDQPWHLQWLLTWNHTPWLRTTVTHAVLALPREGTLWPDLPQVLFPLLGATTAETDRGPLTDRIFSLRFEARWRDAPWPLLPASAGRAYWEYGGEDYIESALPPIPEISAPASVFGVELLSPRWDLLVEYAELQHPSVLWYAHYNFTAGYSRRGWILGFPAGGGSEIFTGALRWRRADGTAELELRGRYGSWEHIRIPGTTEHFAVTLIRRRLLPGAGIDAEVGWFREEAVSRDAFATRDDWIVAAITLRR